MKNRVLFVVIAVLALGAGALLLVRTGDNSRPSAHPSTGSAPAPSASESIQTGAATAARVPAYQNASQAQHLEPTLPPAQFIGKVRAAYKIVKEIPQTIAQLPCYCHCDKSFGHKSLHTCFVDDHASQCAVCVDEALLAYKLEKQDKLTPEQVREVIIEKYAGTHTDH